VEQCDLKQSVDAVVDSLIRDGIFGLHSTACHENVRHCETEDAIAAMACPQDRCLPVDLISTNTSTGMGGAVRVRS
jgi:hypothetical protein